MRACGTSCFSAESQRRLGIRLALYPLPRVLLALQKLIFPTVPMLLHLSMPTDSPFISMLTVLLLLVPHYFCRQRVAHASEVEGEMEESAGRMAGLGKL